MAFVTSKRWVCNTCGRAVEEEPDNWLHVRWWRVGGTVFEIDVCSPKCAMGAEKLLTRTLAASSPPTEVELVLSAPAR